ncbi:MAG: T9SS type A sorting domain-containing protein [Prevotella sp.]|jgi:hypothetical protein|nr:T9SS type A sorting domain-containing protein [Prevotella sp.]
MKNLFFIMFLLPTTLFAEAFVPEDAQSFVVKGENKNYVIVPHFSVPAQLTVEAWIKAPNVSGTKTIVSWKNVAGGSNGDALILRLNGATPIIGEWKSPDWTEIKSNTNVVANTWTHIAATKNGTSVKLYVNGVETGSGTSKASSYSTDNLLIGAIATSASESFVGNIAEVRIWNTIAFVSPEQAAGNEAGLMGYWKLNGNYIDSSANGRDATLYTDERGIYFDKKTWDGAAIPTYSASKSLLPKPVLDGNQGWLSMYDKAWELLFAHIRQPKTGSNFVSNYFDEAFDNTYIYQWDIIFMTLFGKYAHHVFPGIRSLDNFYCRQGSNGSIARMISENNGNPYWSNDADANYINPPLFSWAEVENYRVTGDKSRFASILPVLEKYFEFVELRRNSYDKPHRLFWSNGQSSGMDNTPRDGGRNNGHYSNDHVGWVDISCQMVIQCDNLATICEELGLTEKAQMYRDSATIIGQRINQWMWNESEGMYFDVNTQGTKTAWKTIASFWPMLAGITSPNQDLLMIDNLKDPDLFWRPIPFPTLAKSHSEFVETGGYWLGAVWAPTNYATIKGLQRVGADEFAKEASEKYIEGLYQVYLTTGTLWENYASELIDGNFKQGTNEANPPADCRKDFVGWTGLAPISILIENVLGFRLDGANKILTYDLRRTDRHGIENLRMADITTSVVADDRTGENASDSARITVTADKPYTLRVIFEGEEYVFNIVAGTQVIEIPPEGLGIIPTSAKKISIFPNPVKDELWLAGDFSVGCNFNIRNIAGQMASVGILKNNSINVSSLPTGLYLLYLNGNDKKRVEKFLKQ